jgi:two-component sensor histidine kinase
MAFHELATNAVKYGALSNGTGNVTIRWALTDDSNPRLVLNWRESKGPAVASTRRRGFGTEVMVQMVEHALDADVALDFDRLGVHWRVSAPKATVIDGTRSGLTSFRIGEVA